MLKDGKEQLVKKNGLLHAALSQLKEKQDHSTPKSSLHARSLDDLLATPKESPGTTSATEWDDPTPQILKGSVAAPKRPWEGSNGAEAAKSLELRQELDAAKKKIESLLKERETIQHRLEK